MLPSPAWKTLPMRRRWRSAAAAMARRISGTRGARHDAVLRAVVRRQPADGAERALAAFHSAARSASSRATPHARARRCARQTRLDARHLRVEARPRGRRARRAARRRRRSEGRSGYAASTAPRISRSIISSAAGTMPARDDARDRLARVVDRLEDGEQRAIRLRERASRRSVARVTMPNVPSEPTTRPTRS